MEEDLRDIEKKDFVRVLDIYIQHTFKPLEVKDNYSRSFSDRENVSVTYDNCREFFTSFDVPQDELDKAVSENYKMVSEFFSRIKSDVHYSSSKYVLLGLCFVLKFTLDEANALLTKAGFVLSSNNKADVIIQFFLKNETYDLKLLNSSLSDYDVLK